MSFPWHRIIDYSPYYAEWRAGLVYLLTVTLLCGALLRFWYWRGRRAWLLYLTCLIFVGCGSLWVMNVFPDDGDAAQYLMITHSLVSDGDVELQNNLDREDWRRFRWPLYHYGGLHLAPLPGRSISWHEVGLPLLAAPWYAFLGGRFGMMLFLNLCWLLALVWARGLTRALVHDEPAVTFAVLAVFLTSPMLVFATTAFAEIAGAAALAGLALLAYRRVAGRAQHVLLALLTAVLVLVHTRFVLPALGIWLFLLVDRKWDGLRLLPALLGALALFFGANWLTLGSPLPACLQVYASAERFGAASLWRGLFGLLLDRELGLFVYAPVWLVGLSAWARFLRPHRRYFVLLAAAAGPCYLAVASYDEWHANIGGAARYLVVILPLFTPLLALTYRALAPRAVFRAAAWGLLALSLAIALFHLLVPAAIYGPYVGFGIPQPFVKIVSLRERTWYQCFPSFAVPAERVVESAWSPR